MSLLAPPVQQSSALLARIEALGLDPSEDLEKLSIVRGCRYYDLRNEGEQLRKQPHLGVPTSELPNEEIGIALLSPNLPWESPQRNLHRQRVASAMISGRNVDPHRLAHLAKIEGVEPLVRWIAICGQDVEPDEVFWTELLEALPECGLPEERPHPTRLFALNGMVRGKIGVHRDWIRPGKELV